MKNLIILSLAFCSCYGWTKVHAQSCIGDVYYITVPNDPCLFAGEVNYGICYDPFWSYTWRIIDPVTNNTLFTFPQSLMFFQSLDLFGGYLFQLEVDQDGDGFPDLIESVEYTTCNACAGSSVEVELVECYNNIITGGQGCKVKVTGSVSALNGQGVSPTGTIVLSYLGNGFENCGMVNIEEIIYGDIPVTFQPSNQLNQPGKLVISEELPVRLNRGCYQASIFYEIVNGAHESGNGLPCTELRLDSEAFRCVGTCAGEEICGLISGGDCCAAYGCGIPDYFIWPNNNPDSECCKGFNEFSSGNPPEMIIDSGNSSSNGFEIFPNPSTGLVQVKFPKIDLTGVTVKIHDMNGVLLREEPLEGNIRSMTFDLSGISSGIYIITIRNGNESLFENKIIVKN